MSNAAAIVFCSIISIECVFILIGNAFTIYVFWTNRRRLKRTSCLLINLAVADLLVGLTEPVAVAMLPMHFEEDKLLLSTHDNIGATLATTFSCLSLFSLALISMERAYAVIMPLRHRVTSNKCYVCSLVIVWAAGMVVGVTFLFNLVNVWSYFTSQIIVFSMIIVSLIIICASYLSIRKKLHCRVPAIHQNGRNDEERNMRLSKTLFIVIVASFVCWLPGSVLHFVAFVGGYFIPMAVLYSGALCNITSSIVNPVIYSFRMPIFKEPLGKLIPKRISRNNRGNVGPRAYCKNNSALPIVVLNVKTIPNS
ncbi:adenosine receptor A3-like [Oculina patagonica]